MVGKSLVESEKIGDQLGGKVARFFLGGENLECPFSQQLLARFFFLRNFSCTAEVLDVAS